MIKSMFALAAASGLALAAAPAVAQNQDGLINVNVTDVNIIRDSLNKNDVDVLNNLLRDGKISVLSGTNTLTVPVVLQVPVGIAANVCNTTVAVLSAAGSGGACDAKSSSRALGNIINRQMLSSLTSQ